MKPIRSLLAGFALLAAPAFAADSAATPSDLPVVKAARITADFPLDANLAKPVWQKAKPVRIERETRDAKPRPEISTTVRLLWSDKFLYLAYECPFTTLTMFEPANPDKERFGLWEKDVVEAFIGSNPQNIKNYTEFEVAPNAEKLDLLLDPPKKDFEWSSGFEARVKVDAQKKIWTAEWRIPLSALAKTKPAAGDRWRINLYRCDYANKAFLAWNPTADRTFHVADKFGILEFTD